MKARGYVVMAATFIVLSVAASSWIVKGLAFAYNGWTHDPVRMIALLLVAFLTGQVIGWTLGHDQLGLFMRPFWRVGVGQSLSACIVSKIPATKTVYWVAKLLEVLTDAIRIPIEGALFLRYGYVPDALATFITQPLWTCVEVAEKVGGIAARPEVVGDHGQIELSVACIYGNLVRFAQEAVIWFFGIQIYVFLGSPIESIIHRIIQLF